MEKDGSRAGREQSAHRQLLVPLRDLAREALRDTGSHLGSGICRRGDGGGAVRIVRAALRAFGRPPSAAFRARAVPNCAIAGRKTT